MTNDIPTLWQHDAGFTISTNKQFLQKEVIHQFLSNESYWVKDIPMALVEASITHSTLCYGVYAGNPENGTATQIGFARVVSDFVRFAWLGDVFIVDAYRGRGLSKWLMHIITEHPLLKGTSFQLATQDAHALYAQFGFEPLGQIEKRMSRPLNWQDVYKGHRLAD